MQTDACKLTTLSLSENHIGDQGLRSLARALASPRSRIANLILAHNEIGLRGTRYLAQSMSHEAHASVIAKLNISGNSISDGGIEVLAQSLRAASCRVTSLNVARIRMGIRGARALHDLLIHADNRLTELQMQQNHVRGHGSTYIASALTHAHCNLATLNISDNRIGKTGVRAFGDAISHADCTLTSLTMARNYASSEIGGYIHDALARSTGRLRLTMLDVSHNPLSDEAVAAIKASVEAHPCIRLLIEPCGFWVSIAQGVGHVMVECDASGRPLDPKYKDEGQLCKDTGRVKHNGETW